MKTRAKIWTEGMMFVCFVLILAASESWAADPTLARLSFWVPPERMGEFEAAYQKRVVPILTQHDLIASSEGGWATVDSVFTRAFAFKTPANFEEMRQALLSDPAFEEIRRILGTTFGTLDPSGLIRRGFNIYRSPSGPGNQVAAGFGHRHWRTYDASDGLAHNRTWSILQDREGALWFGTSHGGVSRYDGETFTTFTTQDGLAHNTVRSILQDGEGALWFTTAGGGVTRYRQPVPIPPACVH